MKITIITACFNSIATIRDAIESVRTQKLPSGVELEHLIIDGGSSDGTEKLATISEPDRGMYDAINKGIRMATGDIIGILNADDILASDDVVARIAGEFLNGRVEHKERKELDCVYGKVYFVNALGGKPVRRCFAQLWRPWMLQWGYMPPHPGIFIRKSCFTQWGGYVPDRAEYRIAIISLAREIARMLGSMLRKYGTIHRSTSTLDFDLDIQQNSEIVKHPLDK